MASVIQTVSRFTVSAGVAYGGHSLFLYLYEYFRLIGVVVVSDGVSVNDSQSFRWFTGVFGLLYWFISVWIPVLGFEWLDRKCDRDPNGFGAKWRGWKLATVKTEKRFDEMVGTALKNELCTLVIGTLVFVYAKKLIRIQMHDLSFSYAFM